MTNPSTLFARPTAITVGKKSYRKPGVVCFEVCADEDIDGYSVVEKWLLGKRIYWKFDSGFVRRTSVEDSVYLSSADAHRELAYRHYASESAKQAEILGRCGVKETHE